MTRQNLGPALIWCPFPDQGSAARTAEILLDEKLIGCANMIGSMISLFAWEGRRERSEETGVIFKTHSSVLDRAIARLSELHPYEEPAILGWHCDAAAPATSEWLESLAR